MAQSKRDILKKTLGDEGLTRNVQKCKDDVAQWTNERKQLMLPPVLTDYVKVTMKTDNLSLAIRDMIKEHMRLSTKKKK